MPRTHRWSLAFLGVVALVGTAVPAAAQVGDTTKLPAGVHLKLVYQTSYRPRLAVQAFTGEGAAPAELVHGIVRRDLDYSDRFEIMFSVPSELQAGAVDYRAWNDLGAVFLVTGSMAESSEGYRLRLALHDVVYGSVKEIRAFSLPHRDAADFRMAVHAAADELVRWATGEPGIAASRIATSVKRRDGSYAIVVVDSDGENAQVVTRADQALLSPAWSPDGRRIAYSAMSGEGEWRIEQMELGSGRVRALGLRSSLATTPSYSPDGRRLAFGVWLDDGMEIHDYDVERSCCVRRLSRRARIDMSPTYAPDGRTMAFMSDRLGQPHIYTMPADGGDAVLISPFEYGAPGYYTSPDWSPSGSQIAFHGRSRGQFQIMVGDASRPGAPVQQVTAEGRSEDPSWASDGRHLVFSGVRPEGTGLYVIDLMTGRIRPLVLGDRYRVPAWSGPLLRASELAAGAP